MTRMFFALSLGFGGVIFATQIAFATPQCDTRDRINGLLADSYGETRRAMGITGTSTVMELYASDSTGTWTITLTLADGRMCLMASGQGFEALDDPLPARGQGI